MRMLAPVVLLLAMLPAGVAADSKDLPFTDSREYVFAAGGTVRLKLSAGDYLIRPGEDNHIRITWRTRTKNQLDDVEVQAMVRGKEATITTDGPGTGNNFRVEIELPARSDLHVRMTAGDLRIERFEGNKDISLRAGDLDVDIGEADAYGHVNASVTVGDLNASAFNVSKGGLWRSFTHEGAGRYTLRASLTAGDLKLR